MALQAHISYRGPLGRKVKGMPKAVKNAAQKALDGWQRDALPKHFGPVNQVASRYAGTTFQARTKGYSIRKGKKYGHQNILEFTGELKRNVDRNRIVVTGSKNEFKGRLPGSQKANFRSRPSAPDMRAELTAVNQEEAAAMAAVMDAEITAFLHPDSSDPYETFLVT